MKKFKIISLLLALTLCLSVFAACGKTGETAASSASASSSESKAEAGLYIDGAKVEANPVLTVDGEEISFDAYRYYYLSTRSRFDGGDTALWESEDAEEAKPVLKQYVLDTIKSVIAFERMAQQNNITLSEEELKYIDDSIAAAKESLGGDEAYASALKDMNYTPELYKELLASNMLSSKVIKEIYGDKIKADIAANYIHAKHILVKFDEKSTSTSPESQSAASTSTSAEDTAALEEKALAKITEAAQKLKDGADFDEMMKQYNQDTGEGEDGYYFTEGKMVAEFYEGAKALSENQISEPIKSVYGYHIIQRLPISDEYLEKNMISMMSSEMSGIIDADVTAIMDKFEVTYSEHYDAIAPDTLV